MSDFERISFQYKGAVVTTSRRSTQFILIAIKLHRHSAILCETAEHVFDEQDE